MEGGKEGRAGGDDVVVQCNKWHQALGLTHVTRVRTPWVSACTDTTRPAVPIRKCRRQMSERSGHAQEDTLPVHLGGVDNHKDLLNGAGCPSLYQVFLYSAGDE